MNQETSDLYAVKCFGKMWVEKKRKLQTKKAALTAAFFKSFLSN